MVTLVRHDLEFILKQIKIAEAHSAGTPLTDLVDNPLLPSGLRTVDGSFNNLVPGREQWGASGEPFPRLTEEHWVNEGDDEMPTGYVPGNNNDYGAPDSVVDADPRLISNLVVDQTLANPAAIAAALRHAGHSEAEIAQGVVEIRDAYNAGIAYDAALAAAETARDQAQAIYDMALQAVVDADATTPAATVAALVADMNAAQAGLGVAQDALDVLMTNENFLPGALAKWGLEMDGNTVLIPNLAPDEGLSASYNSWFTLFGQFFDHGLDLVTKGGNGTIYIPLSPDDPLYDPASPHTNFMVLTRASVGDDAANVTTPWVDQNQTYTSHASHQVFLREYELDADGKPVDTGRLLEGRDADGNPVPHTLATWGDVKAQARDVLGIELTDADVGMVPMVRTDPYGNFIPDEKGYVQLILGVGADGVPNSADDVVISQTSNGGFPVNPSATYEVGGVTYAGAVRLPNAFLDDIAHGAAPVNSRGQEMYADHDSALGIGIDLVVNPNFGQPVVQGPSGNSYLLQSLEQVALNPDYDGTQPVSAANPVYLNPNRFYDNEKLDAHYITGDGRGNENIGLTAVHFVFHAEHNRQIEEMKKTIFESADVDFLNEWLREDVTSMPSSMDGLAWDGARLFQAARFATEMQYQHLVFEEFARKVQPDVDLFMVQPDVEIDPAIFAEFANVVYRFGHSMLNQSVDRTFADGTADNIDLFDAFLNPLQFGGVEGISQAEMAGAIATGMSAQHGNEIDEFVTDVLRNQLVGIPLDLAAINIARGRDTGMPTLNQARAQFQDMANGDTLLKPYESWSDFALNLRHPESVINFIAAYGTHVSIEAETTIEGKRDAAMELVFGVDLNGDGVVASDRLDFLNATGTYSGGSLGGLNNVDLWVGGLAEKKMAFGGLLGSTFSFVFQLQMENLQDSDRFYYLSRTQGLNLLTELENNSLAKMVLKNTTAGEEGVALPADIFSKPDHILYMDAIKQAAFGLVDPEHENPLLQAVSSLVQRIDANNDGVAEFIRYNGLDHITIQGTDGDDHIVSGGGDDTVWGGAGNDRIEAGYGVDSISGGAGDDIITNAGTDIGAVTVLKGESGNDVIVDGTGMSLIFGGEGKDYLVSGFDDGEIRGGQGDDFMFGGDGMGMLFGNEGNDWIEGGGGFDYIAGDNGELFFNSTIIGHDVLNGGSGDTDYDADSGDDIMFAGEGIQKNIGMWGHDWVIHQGQSQNVDADMRVDIFTTLPQEVLRDRFSNVEGLSGWDGNDVLRGDDRTGTGPEGGTTADPTPETGFQYNELNQAAIDRIAGLGDIITADMMVEGEYRADGSWEDGQQGTVEDIFVGGNILLGGGGSDTIEGRGGDDVIDGDRYLSVRIAGTTNAGETFTVLSMTDSLTLAGVTKSLTSWMIDGVINPGNLEIVREILDGNRSGDVDTAVYWDVRENYEVTRHANGSVTIAHVAQTAGAIDPVTGRNRESDGTDKLYNMELYRFADGTFTIDELAPPPNSPATGAPVINDLTPTEGQTLTADVSSIADPNGMGALNYQWQVSNDGGATWSNVFDNLQLNSDATFTPNNGIVGFGGQIGGILRVQVTFIDNDGHQEVLTSAPTGVVGDSWTGIELPFVNNTFNGTGGDDIATGANALFLSGNDTLNGFGGDDILNGNGGNDTLNGGAGNDILNGGAGNDVAVYAGSVDNFALGSDGTNFIVTDLTGTEGTDTLSSIETLRFAGANYSVYAGTTGNGTTSGNNSANAVFGLAGNDTLNGNGGNDLLVGGLGNDIVNGGAGNDTVYWTAGDGRDVIDGGTGTDTVKIVGASSAETYRIYSRAEWLAVAGNTDAQLNNADTEIVITRNGTDFASVIAQLDNVEDIIINGRGGGDTFIPIGTFAGTSLSHSTITLEGSQDDDTVDISALTSAHRVVFRSNGGNDTVIGTMRSQDSIELPGSIEPGAYDVIDNQDGTTTFASDGNSVTFSGSPQVAGTSEGGNEGSGIYDLDDEDYEDLLEMIRDGLVRDSSGFGNNETNPSYGSAGYNFIRLTDAHYTDGEAGIRQTTLTPREISDIISNQDNDGDGTEESIPNAFEGSSLLTFFGQYFDHGLGFIAKGQPGNISIGNQTFPINAPRSNIVEGTGVDGIPAEYINSTSPFVDQNQAYGSHNEITDLLRKWELGADGEAQQTAYLLTGDLDAGGRALLPTLSHIRENHRVMTGGDEITSADIHNYMGTGQALLLDFRPVFLTLEDGSSSEEFDLDAIGHYFITGDGRTNENVMLTSIHTVWARNHNFWVDKIKTQTNNSWTEAEYFEAARMMNIAEYQQVVFTEFATAIAGPLGDDDDDDFDFEHGFDGYDPDVDASISVEFAQAVYRFGHSMLNETVAYQDADGRLQQISLVEAFLRPDQVNAIGIDALLSGAAAVSHQAIDVDIVNALRNQLVGQPLDLAALNIFRGRDMGVPPLNIMRAQLYEATGNNKLKPYTGWSDFQQKNGLSNTFIAQLMSAYPDGFETMDAWIGGLAEKPAYGQLGSTFGYVFREQMDRLQHGDRFYYLEIFDDSIFEDSLATFADIIMRNTGITGLPENVFQHAGVIDPSTLTTVEDDEDDTDPIGGGDDVDDVEDVDDQDEGQNGDDNDGADGDGLCDADGAVVPGPSSGTGPLFQVGTASADVLIGTSGNDTLIGHGGDDTILGGGGDDVILGGAGNDHLFGDDGRDVIHGGDGDDDIFGGAGNDTLLGDGGNDRIYGGSGNDYINAGAGNDIVFAGAGDDRVVVEAGDGDDVYYGGEADQDTGVDTLDMSSITADIVADLGTGFMSRGQVFSVQTGNDTIWGFENIVTGSGSDTITASRAVNVMDGGGSGPDGRDTFRFLSAADADGDTILGFAPGDRIDLSTADANACVAGNQSFALVTGEAFTDRGQLMVSHEQREDGDYTIVHLNTTGGTDADYKFAIKGSHNLNADDFHL